MPGMETNWIDSYNPDAHKQLQEQYQQMPVYILHVH